MGNELELVHRIVIRARHKAQVGEDHDKIASLLDEAEILILTLRDGHLSLFRKYIGQISEAYPELSGLASEYDEAKSA